MTRLSDPDERPIAPGAPPDPPGLVAPSGISPGGEGPPEASGCFGSAAPDGVPRFGDFSVPFAELVDLEELRALCGSFTDLTGAALALLDPEGRILVATGWRDICTRFHRVHPGTACRCRESDTVLAGQLQAGEPYNVYRCANGLVDVAVPIRIGGRHAANFYTGQFLFEEPDREAFRRQAREFGFDEEAYLEALERVPVFREEQVVVMMDVLSRLAHLIGETGLVRKALQEGNWRLRREVADRVRAEEALREINDRLEVSVAERTLELTEANRRLNREIVQHEATERELERAKTDAEAASLAKSTFLANISHEIRTPMNAILGFSQLLGEETALSPRQREYLETINTSGRHLLALIDDVLDLSKIEAGRIALRPVPLVLSTMPEELDRLFRPRAEAKGLRFVVGTEGDLSRPVLADGAKLRQVLVNLVGNAVKFTRQGWVTLRIRLLPEEEGLRLFAEVEDTGPGIAEGEQARLFQYFEQARAGREAGSGTGLGLKISRELIRLMGGDILVRSREGAGSTFSFDIPLEEVDPADAPARAEIPPIRGVRPEGSPYRILIVDDMKVNRMLLQRMLEPLGFLIREAQDGQEALRIFGEWRPDLILMDVKMPLMDGFEAIRRIRGLEGEAAGGEGVRIVAVTASAFEEDRRRICEGGADDFLRKPFQGADLMEKIGRLLGPPPGSSPAGETPSGSSAGGIRPLPRAREAPAASDGTLERALGRLPEDLVKDLGEAVREGDYFLILELTDRMESLDPPLAEALKNLAQGMNFRRLMDLLPEEAGS